MRAEQQKYSKDWKAIAPKIDEQKIGMCCASEQKEPHTQSTTSKTLVQIFDYTYYGLLCFLSRLLFWVPKTIF